MTSHLSSEENRPNRNDQGDDEEQGEEETLLNVMLVSLCSSNNVEAGLANVGSSSEQESSSTPAQRDNMEIMAVLQAAARAELREQRERNESAEVREERQRQRRLQERLDDMSYDELLETFGDGTDNFGASDSDIEKLEVSTIEDTPSDGEGCRICLQAFEKGQERKTMPCRHGFHRDCLDRWLRGNGRCPICKRGLNECR